MKVSNIIGNAGNAVKNQFVINNGQLEFFQSYHTIIIKKDYKENKTYLDNKALSYSRTTSKYLYIFLGETRKEIEAKIKSGEYILTDLNQ